MDAFEFQEDAGEPLFDTDGGFAYADETVVERARAGDPRAPGRLVRANRPLLHDGDATAVYPGQVLRVPAE